MDTLTRRKRRIKPDGLPGLQLWLDTFDPASVILDSSGNVQEWSDKSGFGRNAIQSNAANRPSWLIGQLNGYGAIKPNGTNQWLDVPSMPEMSAGWTVLIITRRGASTSVGIIGANAGTANSALIIGPGTSTNLQISQWGASVNVAGPSLGSGVDFGILASYDGSHTTGNFSIRASTNATPATGTMTQAVGTPPSATWSIARYGSVGSYYGSNIYEIVVYNRQISSGEEMLLQSYTMNKWGLVWS